MPGFYLAREHAMPTRASPGEGLSHCTHSWDTWCRRSSGQWLLQMRCLQQSNYCKEKQLCILQLITNSHYQKQNNFLKITTATSVKKEPKRKKNPNNPQRVSFKNPCLSKFSGKIITSVSVQGDAELSEPCSPPRRTPHQKDRRPETKTSTTKF